MLIHEKFDGRGDCWGSRLALAAPLPRRPRFSHPRYEPSGKARVFVDLSGHAEIIAVTSEWLAFQAMRSLH